MLRRLSNAAAWTYVCALSWDDLKGESVASSIDIPSEGWHTSR
jgi:hypothetical protein